MKKAILVVVAVLAVALIAFAVVAAMQPSDFRIERSTVIAAPPEDVFEQVNDFHNWEAWSPWAKLDPNMKTTFTGEKSGEGASYAWVGNSDVGEGKMTIVESEAPEHVRIKLEFIKPFAATYPAEFAFEPEDDGTRVTWSMHGKWNFMSKAAGLFMDMDKTIGADFEKGLAQLKTEVEKNDE